MISISVRRALIGMTVAAAVVAFTIPVALAQPAPAANPVCGSAAGLMNHALAKFTGGAVGRNYVSVQRVSPINGSPDNAANNGFQKLCIRMGLTPTGDTTTMASIDGDANPDNADLFQFDGSTGTVATYRCDQLISSNSWDEGSGVEIRPQLTNAAATTVSMITPGVECSQRYAVYEGVNYFPVPLSTTCTDRVCLCTQLHLPDGTQLQMIDAAAGAVENFNCGQLIDPFGALRIGEAARIEPLGASGRPAFQPINCLSGSNPCPATPSNDYPAPLIY